MPCGLRVLQVGSSVLARVQINSIARSKVTFGTKCIGSQGEELIIGTAVAVLKKGQ